MEKFNRTLILILFAVLVLMGGLVFAENNNNSVTERFRLEQNYPNPFNPSTQIEYELPASTEVTLKVYNLLGQEVKTLVTEIQGKGVYTVEWNGTNHNGLEVAGGIYFYRLISDTFVQTRKMILLK
jgi:flagellar hook assembly protein FlgD